MKRKVMSAVKSLGFTETDASRMVFMTGTVTIRAEVLECINDHACAFISLTAYRYAGEHNLVVKRALEECNEDSVRCIVKKFMEDACAA